MSEERKTYTLMQLTSSIARMFDKYYNQSYWVKAEMHKLNLTTKGHCYPELLQKENGNIVVQMRATIWKTQFEAIKKNFEQTVKEPIKDGLTLLFLVKVTYHPLYGIGLNILDIDPNFSLGELQKERQETLLKLKAKGLLNKNQMLNIAKLPKTLAIISVASSKGLSDFLTVLANNSFGYKFHTKLFPAILDGDRAAQTILNALAQIEKHRQVFDAVVIVRGGGGEIGLTCYNNYELCAAIAQFPLPILTGIGHSTNLTVTEMIAFANAITPTQLADYFLSNFRQFDLQINELKQAVIQQTQEILRKEKRELLIQSKFFRNGASKRFLIEKERLIQIRKNIKRITNLSLEDKKLALFRVTKETKKTVQYFNKLQLSLLENKQVELKNNTRRRLFESSEIINQIKINLFNRIQTTLSNQQMHLTQFEKNIQFINPENLFEKGYSITLFNGKVISKENQPNRGDTIITQGTLGNIESVVEKVDIIPSSL